MKEQAAECQKLANRMRMDMVEIAGRVKKTMHWGGSLSSAEIFAVLYKEVLNVTDAALNATEKDKFLLSKGHAALGVYTAMHQVGLLSDEQLNTYQENGSDLSELIEYNRNLGFEFSGGSLGIGLSYGVGLALLAKRKAYSYHTYVEVGDGELDEGAVWEAIMSAGDYQVDNLTMIIDLNGGQSDGKTRHIVSEQNLKKRLESFGWKVTIVDGHNCEELLKAFFQKERDGSPKVVIASTVKGKGISFMENNFEWHDRLLKGEELELARKEVEALVSNG